MIVFSKRLLAQMIIPASIIICSLLLATYWVFLIPILQAPDEDCHCDYLFSLYSRGKLFKAASAPEVGCSHPYVRYLFDITNGQPLKLVSYAQLPSDYGTNNFFQRLDGNMPSRQLVDQCNTNPGDAVVYPFLYYALAAIVLKVLSCFSTSLSFLFFSARVFSVILYGVGLGFSYLSLLELGLSKRKASLILLATAFFPMVIFVSAYVQPDNMSFAIISILFYLALRWRNKSYEKDFSFARAVHITGLSFNRSFKKEGQKFWLMAFLMGLLFIKYQFVVCVGLPVLAMIITRSLQLKTPAKSLLARVLVILLPLALLTMTQLWVSWGSHLPIIDAKHVHWHPTYTAFVQAIKNDAGALLGHIINGTIDVYNCIYCIDGKAFSTFWGSFGHCNVPLTIINPGFDRALRWMICLLSQAFLLLTLVSLVKVLISLFRLVRKNHLLQAAVIAFSNPLINSYLLFCLLMFVFFVLAYPSVWWQGRHWFALIFPLVLTAACYTPRVFKSRKIRNVFFYTLIGSWIMYSLVGSCYAIDSMQKRYYSWPEILPITTYKLKRESIHVPDTFYILQYFDRYPSFDIHPDYTYGPKSDFSHLELPAGADIWVEGKAVDPKADAPASAVMLHIDDAKMYQGTRGRGIKTDDEKQLFCGFGVIIPTKGLAKGKHSLSMKFISADRRVLYNVSPTIKIFVK